MNIASWIILAVLVVWAAFAIKAAFFKGKSGKREGAPTGDPRCTEDEKYRIEMPQCGGCDKSSCNDCPLARGDIPMPTIRELK